MSEIEGLNAACEARQIDVPAEATNDERVDLLAASLAADPDVESMPGPSSLIPHTDRVATAIETALANPSRPNL